MDMKPHNILLTDSLDSVVMDLGSAGPSDVHITSRFELLQHLITLHKRGPMPF